jgi:hypothetical protein
MQYRFLMTLQVFVFAAAAQAPAPDAVEQKKVLADATTYVINHERNLPNFFCTQTTRRFEDPTGKEVWRPIDIIVERLTYFEHHEDYKVFLLNGRPANLSHKELGGASSSGEFGSVMKGIFAPVTEAKFGWQGWFTVRGRKMQVYSYQVLASKSDYHIVVREEGLDLVPAYHGLIFIDDRTHSVYRITMHADGIPPTFPVQDVSLILDYEYASIGDANYLLPLEFELRSRQGNHWIKNDVGYDSYRKFSADSSITFDSAVKPDK